MWTATEEADKANGVPQQRESASTPRPVPRSGSEGIGGRVSKSLVIDGSISGSEDLFVEGRVKGSIQLRENSLTIGPDGVVEADVEARNIVVHGRLTGSVHECDRIEISKTGTVEGDVTAGRISVEDGAVFRGTVNVEERSEPRIKTELRKAETAVVGESGGSAQKRKQA